MLFARASSDAEGGWGPVPAVLPMLPREMFTLGFSIIELLLQILI